MFAKVASDVARFVEDFHAIVVQAAVLLDLALLDRIEARPDLVLVCRYTFEFRV